MEINNKITKEQGRKAMLDMLEQREGKLSGRSNAWVRDFWSRRAIERCEIRRALGVGVASMSNHLRIYKDPFEPSESQCAFASGDILQQSSGTQAVAVQADQLPGEWSQPFPSIAFCEFEHDD